MPTVSPENNKFIYSRITFEIADAIKAADNNMLHIDDALIVDATPAVLLNYKAIEERDLKRIMVSLYNRKNETSKSWSYNRKFSSQL